MTFQESHISRATELGGLPSPEVSGEKLEGAVDKPPMQIVWIKRDLRTRDHAPLAEAEASGLPYRVIFIFEPSLVAHPDCSDRHLRFQWQSIQDMQQRLGRPVDGFWGEARV